MSSLKFRQTVKPIKIVALQLLYKRGWKKDKFKNLLPSHDNKAQIFKNSKAL